MMASDDDSDDVLECRVGTSVTKLNWDVNAFEVRFGGFEGLHARKSNDNFVNSSHFTSDALTQQLELASFGTRTLTLIDASVSMV